MDPSENKKLVLTVLVPIFPYPMILMTGPIIGGLAVPLFSHNPLRSDNHFVGLDNFVRFVQDPVFWKVTKNTLFFAVTIVALSIVISLGIVQLISMFKSNKTRNLSCMIFFLPCAVLLIVSSVVRAKSILPTTNELTDMALCTLGLAEADWLGNPDVFMRSIIVFSIWADIDYNIILLMAGIDGVPGEFYEAADSDGVSGWQKFRYIALLLLKRASASVIIMILISHFQAFMQPAVMVVRNGPQNSELVLTSYTYKTVFETRDMGYAPAISPALFMITIVASLIQQRANKVEWEY